MEIKSLNAPALGEADLNRLWAFTDPRRLTNADTLFDVGYEEAKRDLRDKIATMARRPSKDTMSVRSAADKNSLVMAPVSAQEARARRDRSEPLKWWPF